MLAALNVIALLIGVAGGGLAATILALLFGGILSVVGVPYGPEVGLLAGVFVGLVFGGLVAGRLAVHSHRFHGSIVGLFLAAGIIFLSRGATGVSIQAVLTLALAAVVLGGFGGWLGGRSRPVSP
jgi:hypothetical protein